MNRLFISILAGASIAAISVPAAAACYRRAEYAGSLAALARLPSDQERAAMDDRAVAAAYDALETALVRYLRTAGKSCRTAAPARRAVYAATDALIAAGEPIGAVCCTHWNTSTGGTGCATYEGECPDDLFECTPTDDGECW